GPFMAAGQGATYLHEGFEDRLLIFLRDPRPGIRDGDHDLAVAHPTADRHPASGRRELHRITEQVQDDLLRLRLIGHADEALDAGTVNDRDSLRDRLWLDHGQHVVHHVVERRGGHLVIDLAGFDAAVVEQIVDDAE